MSSGSSAQAKKSKTEKPAKEKKSKPKPAKAKPSKPTPPKKWMLVHFVNTGSNDTFILSATTCMVCLHKSDKIDYFIVNSNLSSAMYQKLVDENVPEYKLERCWCKQNQ